MTISHTGIKTPAAQHNAVVAWYEAALAPLGYKRAMAFLDDQVVGFADAIGVPEWWVTSAAAAPPGVPAPASASVAAVLPTHTAFVAKGSFIPLHCLRSPRRFYPTRGHYCCGGAMLTTPWVRNRSRGGRGLPQGGGGGGRQVQRPARRARAVRADVLRRVCVGPGGQQHRSCVHGGGVKDWIERRDSWCWVWVSG